MSAPKCTIASACGALLARGVPAAQVLLVEERLRRLADGGLSATVELPEYNLSVTLPAPGGARRKQLARPASVTR